jgi:hypothetical protein
MPTAKGSIAKTSDGQHFVIVECEGEYIETGLYPTEEQARNRADRMASLLGWRVEWV